MVPVGLEINYTDSSVCAADCLFRLEPEGRVKPNTYKSGAAKACAEAGEVDLSVDPAEAADDEITYWDADE